MKLEIGLAVLKTAAFSASAATAGAAGAGVASAGGEPTAWPMAAALLLISGLCAVVGGFFFNAHDDEHPTRDIIVTIAFPLLLGFGLGPFAGEELFDRLEAIGVVSHAYRTPIAEHIVGGLGLGVAATPMLRFGLRRLQKLGEKP